MHELMKQRIKVYVAGLLAEDAIYRDIVMECRGLPAVMGYANVTNSYS